MAHLLYNHLMRNLPVLLLAAAACLSAQVKFSPSDVAVNVDGKAFTTFHYGDDANKPFLAPLRSASGKIVTRHFPMETVAGETTDHLHHRGQWFSYDDVNGVKFWENDPSYKHPNMGRIVVRKADWKDGDRSGTLTASLEWRGPDQKPLILETREMVFYSDPKLRTIDFNITLAAAQDLTFGDTKEGAFAIRLDDRFTMKKGGKMMNAEGADNMANIWGKKSNWVDYTAMIDGESLGVAMFDHPSNPRHPTYWHARDYGLFALNPFGQKAFDPKMEESHWKLPAGQKLVFHWRVVIHPGDANVAELYKSYAASH
jgi:Methane oxygenase PmoA